MGNFDILASCELNVASDNITGWVEDCTERDCSKLRRFFQRWAGANSGGVMEGCKPLQQLLRRQSIFAKDSLKTLHEVPMIRSAESSDPPGRNGSFSCRVLHRVLQAKRSVVPSSSLAWLAVLLIETHWLLQQWLCLSVPGDVSSGYVQPLLVDI